MANVEKMSISLPKEMAEIIGYAMASGMYASSSEVMREALRYWHENRVLELGNTQELKALWKEGEKSETSAVNNREELKARLRKALKESK